MFSCGTYSFFKLIKFQRELTLKVINCKAIFILKIILMKTLQQYKMLNWDFADINELKQQKKSKICHVNLIKIFQTKKGGKWEILIP